MKKNLILPLLPLVVLVVVAFTPLKKENTTVSKKTTTTAEDPKQVVCAPYSNSTFIYDGCLPSPPNPFGSGCIGGWKVLGTIGSVSVSGGVVTFTTVPFCYWVSTSVPWTSSTLLGNAYPAYRPSATRVFNATAANGATIQCTVYTNGDWYIQKTAGTTPGQGTNISGSYSL